MFFQTNRIEGAYSLEFITLTPPQNSLGLEPDSIKAHGDNVL
jgi:hypothetical protein